MSERRIPSLDGLRAISITLVILSHLVKWKHISLDVLGSYGTMGVFIFFVLSGYLITNLLLREYERTSTVSLRDFYLRRAFRIFPAAFVFFAVAIVIYWRQMNWFHVAAAVFYFANMDMARPWIFGHLWSLSIEEQFYMLWPFALKKWYRHRTTIVLCAFCISPVFRTVLYAFKVRNGWLGSLPIFSSQLAIGCLLAILAPRLPKIKAWVAPLMLAALILAPWFPAITPGRTLFSLFVLSPLVHISAAGLVLHVIQVPYRFLNWQPVAWLGKISYSLYLWQEMFCSNAALHGGYLLLLPALACACFSYYLVEQPMLRLRDRWTRGMAPRLRHAVLARSVGASIPR
ncbi:MAG TPA: acyltransferase [Candidatus Sulfotelmatobacter sp.]|nr:acyltransferase [Candidatus Sulfotelmatobacter sp.]